MATTAAVAKLLECPICLEILKEPKTLICDHSFCKLCLANMIKSKYMNKDHTLNVPAILSVICPVCNGNSQEFHSLDDMRSSHIINQLLEARTIDEGVKDDRPHMCSCTKVATVICYRCKSVYCSCCCNHQLEEHCTAVNKGLSTFMEGTAQHFFVKMHSQGFQVYICKDHSLPLDLYCTRCQETICVNCFLSLHRDHNTKPIKYGRDQAVRLIEIIKSIELDNMPACEYLLQVASDVLKNADTDGKYIIEQIDAQERKLHGLISSLFSKAKVAYKSSIGIRSKAAEKAITFCQESMSKRMVTDFDQLDDFELASLVKKLISLLNRLQFHTFFINERLTVLKEDKYQETFQLCVNEEAIFNAILGVFNHVKLRPQLGGKFIPQHGFSFEDYINGNYAYSDEENSYVRPRERISYSRNFLLSLRHYYERPNFPGGLEDILCPSLSNESQQRNLREIDYVEAPHEREITYEGVDNTGSPLISAVLSRWLGNQR